MGRARSGSERLQTGIFKSIKQASFWSPTNAGTVKTLPPRLQQVTGV